MFLKIFCAQTPSWESRRAVFSGCTHYERQISGSHAVEHIPALEFCREVKHALQRQFGGLAQLSVQQDFVVPACQGVFDAAQRIHRHPRAERAAFAASAVARRRRGDKFFVGRLLLHFVQDAQIGRHNEFFFRDEIRRL